MAAGNALQSKDVQHFIHSSNFPLFFQNFRILLSFVYAILACAFVSIPHSWQNCSAQNGGGATKSRKSEWRGQGGVHCFLSSWILPLCVCLFTSTNWQLLRLSLNCEYVPLLTDSNGEQRLCCPGQRQVAAVLEGYICQLLFI